MKEYQILLGILALILVALGYTLFVRPPSQPVQRPESTQSAQTSTQKSEDCSGKATPASTEGPYYKAGSPERTNLRQTSTIGTALILNGYVFDINCQPIAGAWLDFWQADGNGNYDNVGYKLRGHQFTDESGKYSLQTVIPGRYPTRTPHIHVKVRASGNSPVLTTQLFLPQEPQNQTDVIFNEALTMKLEGTLAIFNFTIAR